jgi:dienelactone hydrolase
MNINPLIQPGTTLAEWEARRKKLLDWWLDFLGKMPEPRPPPAMETLRTEHQAGLVFQQVSYAVGPDLRAEAYLVYPENIRAPAPGMVVFHPTTLHTNAEPVGRAPDVSEARHLAIHLARRGYVTLSPICFIFGYKDARFDQAEWVASFTTATQRMQRDHPNWRGMTKMVWDGLRAVDALAALPFVDPKRIGCIGHSLGAKESFYLAAFDPRIQAAAASEPGIGLHMCNWKAIHYLGADIDAPGFDHDNHEVISLIAPRGFLLIGGGATDGPASLPFIEAARPVYRLYGDADWKLGLLTHAHGHECVAEVNAEVFRWLDRILLP